MSIYQRLGYHKKLLTSQDVVDRAAARRNRHIFWADIYAEQRRYDAKVIAMFAFAFLFLIAALFYPELSAWWARR